MADEGTPIAETPKKASKGPAKTKKAKPAASHPKISVMVNAAIKDLKERGGSSLQAIKKYIASNYKVDIERMAPFIKKYLKTAVASGELVQTKGTGASGSFKLKGATGKAEGNPKSAKSTKKPKTAAAAKKTVSKPPKKTSVKKVTKKPKAEKKSKPAKSPKKPKAKAAAKPKPKPKKAAKPAPKKAATKRGRK